MKYAFIRAHSDEHAVVRLCVDDLTLRPVRKKLLDEQLVHGITG